MRKLNFTLIILLLTMLVTYAQKGEVSSSQLSEIRKSFEKDANSVALINAVSNNKLNDLALNREEVGKIDHNFKYEVNVSGITNQKSSGRCWMFTSYNVFRPQVMAKYNISSFEFSTNYLFFWDMFEKSNMFLERIIATANQDIYDREVHKLFDSPVGDGGAWNTFTNLTNKYGAVPKSAMPETYSSEHTSNFTKILKEKLRKDGLELREAIGKKASKKEIEAKKIEMLKEVYRILVLNLGEPPVEFEWRYKDKDNKISEYKKYTPKSFWEESIGANLDEFVMFIDDPSREYYKLYEVDNDRNVIEGVNWLYINLPAAELKKYALESIKDNRAMYFSCDVGKQLENSEGILSLENYDYESLYGIDLKMTKKQRMMAHQSGSSHGMALVAVDLDKDGNFTKWRVENSWGASSGNNGYLTITDDWFNEYMYRLVIEKKYLDDKILDILKQKPTKVPYYNPAFIMDM